MIIAREAEFQNIFDGGFSGVKGYGGVGVIADLKLLSAISS